jgi:hypothetical protein
MEGMNPFWYQVVLVATIAGPAFLVFTIVAGIVWFLLRSKTSGTIFAVLLACTALAVASWLAGVILIGTKWP